jgi:tryptophanyl-tRNA synthetase
MDGETEQKIIYSAIKPSGRLTLGNYIGALINWRELSKKHVCFYTVADMHAITVDIKPAFLRENSLDLFASFIALGLDPVKHTLFVQSQVGGHAELTWVLNCFTSFGEARRMTQFKDKSRKNPDNINVGLFDYPVLMAADILLYNADYVPIGKDQQQHLELSRTIAERFNSRFSPTFTVPEGIYPEYGAKIYSLQDPVSKMGKSEADDGGCVYLYDDPDTIARKFKRAVTDSGNDIRFDRINKPGVSNLLTIYAAASGCDLRDAEARLGGGGYEGLKAKVAEAVIEALRPIREAYTRIRADKPFLMSLIEQGRLKAKAAAGRVISKVYRKIGFI